MANKHITNPCSLGGKPAPSAEDTAYWVDPTTNTTKVVCRECYAFVSINRKSKTYRQHNISQYQWLTKVTDPEVVTGVDLEVTYGKTYALHLV